MTLSDLSHYSMTRSIARYLCDSWACWRCLLPAGFTWNAESPSFVASYSIT